MRNYFAIILIVTLTILSHGCTDPSANKPKASLGNAQPESTASKPASAEKFGITPDNSKVELVASKVTRTHNGSFKQFSGVIDLVPNSIESGRVTIDIDTASVTTDDEGLTTHLKTPDFFDVAKIPKATFVSTKIEPKGGTNYEITGNFDLHGVKKAITFPAAIEVIQDAVLVNAEFTINRKDFGIVYAGKADDLIREGVVIKLTVKAPRTK
jgi:polyisoprenoid-binding protein YceI